MPMTNSGIYVPDLHSTDELRAWTRGWVEGCRAIDVGLGIVATKCAAQWNDLPIDHSRFGRAPGTIVARHIRYMADLARQSGIAAGMLWQDYNTRIVTPLQVKSAPKWKV
jgi:hypothetical protein